jgi:hypothetical protein
MSWWDVLLAVLQALTKQSQAMTKNTSIKPGQTVA